MKKFIVIPFGICLFCIAMSGYYIRSRYIVKTDAKKELLVSCAENVRMQIRNSLTGGAEPAYIVRPLVGRDGILSENPEEHHAASIAELEKYYGARTSFIRRISVYDRYGNTFNIYHDNDDGRFIKDNYKSRVINVIRSEREFVIDNATYSYVLPIFYGDTLAGNVGLHINVDSISEYLLRPYLDKEGIRPGVIFATGEYLIYPPEDSLTLSEAEKITGEINRGESGFLTGKINADKVLTYYERLPAPGYLTGQVISYDISPDISSALTEFAVVCFVLSALTGFAVFLLRRRVLRCREEGDERERLLRFMSAAYRNAPAGILVTRRNRLFSGNDRAFRLLEGYVSRDDVGKDISTIAFPPGYDEGDDREAWTPCTFERGGKEICLDKNRITVEEAACKYTVDVFRDISEPERIRRDAVRSNIAKSELLSRISTDFKKPLDCIENAVVLLTGKYPEEPNLVPIRESAASLSGLIDNVQDFADIEAGRIVPDEIPFNAVDTLKKTADMYRGEAGRKGIALKVHISSTAICEVIGDPQRFGQVAERLLSNAVKFTDEGEIRVSMETVKMQDGKVMIKCSVEDTGRGMPKKKLKNLFSIDLRVGEKGEPIGLGVIVAKKLTEIMGGTIRVTSPSPISTRPDAPGVQFSFTVQCYADRELDKKRAGSPTLSHALIISPDAHRSRYLSNHLTRKGVSTDIFVCNKDSAELLINKLIIDKDRYQIVIAEAADNDSGFAVAEEIYRRGLTEQSLYVLIVPAHRPGNYLKARSLRMDYYFVKSDDMSGFDAVLKNRFPPAEPGKSGCEVLRKDLRIMVAENNPLSQTVARMVFKNLGYGVDFAKNESELAGEMHRNTYDILFLDLKFPPADGFRVTEALREKGYKLPIIAMTSTQTKENLKNISSGGMNGCVPKPLNAESIRNVLLKWFV